MRTTVTVVTPARASREDTMIEAPGSAPLREIVKVISRLVGAPPDSVATVDGQPVDAMSPLAGSLLREGAILTIGDSSRGPREGEDREQPPPPSIA